VLQQPLSMPCGHNFCKGCLDKRFAEAEAAQGSKALAEAKPARSLRVRKVGVGADAGGEAQWSQVLVGCFMQRLQQLQVLTCNQLTQQHAPEAWLWTECLLCVFLCGACPLALAVFLLAAGAQALPHLQDRPG
jgi:hypothetical protein